jgi:uncharacterized DUF497 family protein
MCGHWKESWSVFEWDESNLDHIQRHGVQPEEVEEALLDPYRIPAPAYRIVGERRRAILGTTANERLLCVVFTRRGALMRVVTARGALASERRRYTRRGK